MNVTLPAYDRDNFSDKELNFISFLKNAKLNDFKLNNITYYGFTTDIVISFSYHDDNTVFVVYLDENKNPDYFLHYQILGSKVYTLQSDKKDNIISSVYKQFYDHFKLRVKLLFY